VKDGDAAAVYKILMGDGAYGRADIGGGISFELPARRFQDGVQLEVS